MTGLVKAPVSRPHISRTEVITLHIYHDEIMNIRGPFEKFVDCRQCAAVMQREAVTVMPSCSGGGNVVVA
jgi:hypothetical protein